MPKRSRADSPTKACTIKDCDRALRARGLCAMHYKRAHEQPTRYRIQCAVCGVEHFSGRPNGKYCSDECKGLDYSDRMRQLCKLPRDHPVRQAVNALVEMERWPPGRQGPTCSVFFTTCQVCQALFTTRYTTITCSDECATAKRSADRKEHEHRRRARKRNAFIAPVFRLKIYERDGWRCGICHRLVKRNVSPHHPLAPSLDHIIQLAHGGTHEPDNVRCAHLLCNSKRGAEMDSVQLLLVG